MLSSVILPHLNNKTKQTNLTIQGSHGSWKTSKVMEFFNFIFQAWKVLKFRCGSWKVMKNQYTYSSMNEKQ